MSSSRVWLFRGLVAVTASMMVTSFTMPWWIANLSGVAIENTVITMTLRIYAYGFYPAEFPFIGLGYLAEDVTPFYQTVLAWVYITASVGLILYSTWLKGVKGRWLLGCVGLIYIAYATIAAFVVIASRTSDFGISLQGYSVILQLGTQIPVEANLPFGYYLAHTSGLMCIALALLRNKIIGKSKLGA